METVSVHLSFQPTKEHPCPQDSPGQHGDTSETFRPLRVPGEGSSWAGTVGGRYFLGAHREMNPQRQLLEAGAGIWEGGGLGSNPCPDTCVGVAQEDGTHFTERSMIRGLLVREE